MWAVPNQTLLWLSSYYPASRISAEKKNRTSCQIWRKNSRPSQTPSGWLRKITHLSLLLRKNNLKPAILRQSFSLAPEIGSAFDLVWLLPLGRIILTRIKLSVCSMIEVEKTAIFFSTAVFVLQIIVSRNLRLCTGWRNSQLKFEIPLNYKLPHLQP